MQDNQQNDRFYNNNHAERSDYSTTEQNPEYSDLKGLEEPIKWTASEFVQHDKNPLWYLGLSAVTIFTASLSFLLLNKDIFAPAIVVVLGIVFGIAGARKPRVLEYSLEDTGLNVGQRHFIYEEFKSFGVLSESVVSSIILMPSKRFSPALTLYVPQELLDDVVDVIGMYLPLEQHEIGYLDKFLSKIKY